LNMVADSVTGQVPSSSSRPVRLAGPMIVVKLTHKQGSTGSLVDHVAGREMV
jgi:hypothetical protein